MARWPAFSRISRCICWHTLRYSGWPCGLVRSSIRCMASRALNCIDVAHPVGQGHGVGRLGRPEPLDQGARTAAAERAMAAS